MRMTNPTKSAVAKTLSTAAMSDLDSFCSPLKNIGINAFFYSRFIGTNRVNCISNNFKWLQHLHDNIMNYKKNFENQFHFRPGFSIDFMNMFSKEEMTIDMMHHDMKNGIYISNIAKDSKFSEIFIFTTSEAPDSSSQKLLEKVSTLHQFSLHFKEKAQEIIQNTQLNENEISALNNIEHNFASINHEIYVPEITKYYLGSQYHDIYLTKTQFLYVKEFLHGKSYKQIANKFLVSSRTVEKQLELVKLKLGCNPNKTLFDAIRHSSLFHPIFLQKD